MKFNKQHREYAVGAQFIGAPPIYRPMACRCAPQADKSAMCTINRHLRHGRFWSVNFIIGSGHGEPAPTLPAPVWLLPYKHFIRLGGSNACNQGGEGA